MYHCIGIQAGDNPVRFVKQAEEVGHVDLKKRKKRPSRLDPYQSDILGWIAEHPDLTLAQLCARLIETHGLRVGSSTLDDWLRANQITYKKNGSRQ